MAQGLGCSQAGIRILPITEMKQLSGALFISSIRKRNTAIIIKKSVVNCKNSIITIKSECIHFSQENQVNYSLKTSSKLKLGACTMALWRKVIAAPAEDLS